MLEALEQELLPVPVAIEAIRGGVGSIDGVLTYGLRTKQMASSGFRLDMSQKWFEEHARCFVPAELNELARVFHASHPGIDVSYVYSEETHVVINDDDEEHDSYVFDAFPFLWKFLSDNPKQSHRIGAKLNALLKSLREVDALDELGSEIARELKNVRERSEQIDDSTESDAD